MPASRLDLTVYYLKRLAESPFRRATLLAFRLIRNAPTLGRLLRATPGSNLEKLVELRPELFHILVTRFVAVNWNVRTRVDQLIDHCKTVESIGGIVDLRTDTVLDLIRLDAIDIRYRLSLDQARWQLSEGQLVMSLWDGAERIYSLSFSFASHGSTRIVYIGGIQGLRQIDILDRYRHFTKLASGMRPRDFLIETFKTFCRAFSVDEMRAVSDANHVSKCTGFARFAEANPEVKLLYDEVWRERGGAYGGNGFFILPTAATRRPIQELPPKKRATYRKRYMMLDEIDSELTRVLKSGPGTRELLAQRTDWLRRNGHLPEALEAG